MSHMWDGRSEGGQWSSFAAPLKVIVTEGLWLILGVIVVAENFDGMTKVLLLAFVLAAFTIMVVRDLRGVRSNQVEQ